MAASDALCGQVNASPQGEAAVLSIERSIVFAPDDYKEYVGGGCSSSSYAYSGSYAGRNIEKMYATAKAKAVLPTLAEAVHRCFSEATGVRHVLIASGFFVLHNHGAVVSTPAIAPGSCETDGPLGALALLRAFAFRRIHVSLFNDRHNGPVLQQAYDTMLEEVREVDPQLHADLSQYSRCLPFVSDEEEDGEDLAALSREAFGEDGDADIPVRKRALRTVLNFKKALREAWGGEGALLPVDALFAIERLGAPYRNIRGKDISEHTEPIDCLWSMLSRTDEQPGSPLQLDEESARALNEFLDVFPQASVRALRKLAGVQETAVTLAIGDGGNEVGMASAAHLEGIAKLSPGGEFAALTVNGCYRSSDYTLLVMWRC
eukprot:TRINITY_DN42371_c0_g1_i3.p1 TRINITY_DN42371_c0_g1~~TRINITY_DN42371_c0_g1_i3.p1  ORF type:complete len:376 (+),score=66.55 TRINITY_DN42371_c0_g1_i3:82-1209(+)